MRTRGNHSFCDRLARANIDSLTDEQLLIPICSDSPNSSDITCEVKGINGVIKKQLGAVSQIMRDYPEHILTNDGNSSEMQRIINLILVLPPIQKNEILKRLKNSLKTKNSARPLEGKAERGRV